MKSFKFLRGTIESPELRNIETYATASFADTPEGHMNRRMLYYTNSEEYNRQTQLHNENGIRFNERGPELLSNYDGNVHRDNYGNTDYVPFSFGRTKVTRVNPKWWMKIKMFYQKFKNNDVINTHSEAIGIFVIVTSISLGFGIILSKLLNIW